VEHSDKSAQAADRDMIEVLDYSVLAESNLQQLHEGKIRPFGLYGHMRGNGLLIASECFDRLHTHPLRHGSFRRVACGRPPRIRLAVRIRQTHWPQEYYALPIDAGEDCYRHAFTG